MFYFIAWGNPETCTPTDEWRRFCHAVPGVDLNPDWSPIRTLDNNFLQDRDAMRGDDSFTGIPGIPNQDIAMWVGMGPIVDRSKDILGASDMAIVEFRRLMVDAAKAMAETGEAFDVGAAPARRPILSGSHAQRGRLAHQGRPGKPSRRIMSETPPLAPSPSTGGGRKKSRPLKSKAPRAV